MLACLTLHKHSQLLQDTICRSRPVSVTMPHSPALVSEEKGVCRYWDHLNDRIVKRRAVFCRRPRTESLVQDSRIRCDSVLKVSSLSIDARCYGAKVWKGSVEHVYISDPFRISVPPRSLRYWAAIALSKNARNSTISTTRRRSIQTVSGSDSCTKLHSCLFQCSQSIAAKVRFLGLGTSVGECGRMIG